MSLAERLDAAGDLTSEETSVARTYVEKLQKAGIVSLVHLIEAVRDTKKTPDVREMACRLLAWLGVRNAAPVLARALDETEDEDFTWAAANALVRLRAGETAAPILGVLERGSLTKQSAAAWILGWLGEPEAIPFLRIVATDPRRAVDVRAHATEALGVLQAQEAVSDLVTILSDESAELRYWAAYSLGQIADPLSKPELERVASTDVGMLSNDRSVRQEALDALAAIRARERGSNL